MATEPDERPIEKWLRHSARQRREQAGPPFELHPATRRLLQGEVTRQFPPVQRSPFLARFWPQIAFAAVGVLALLVTILAVLPRASHDRQQLLAKNESVLKDEGLLKAQSEPQPTMRLDEAPAPAAAPASVASSPPLAQEAPAPRTRAAPAPTVGAPYTADKETTRETVVIKAESSGVVPPAANTDQVLSSAQFADASRNRDFLRRYGVAAESDLKTKTGFSGGMSGGAGPVGAAAPQTVFAPAPGRGIVQTNEVLAITENATAAAMRPRRQGAGSAAGSARQFFRSTPPALPNNAPSSAAQAVLVSFSLEQAGQQLRAVDQDGSIYSGSLQDPGRADLTASRQLSLRAPPQEAPAVASSTDALNSAWPQYFFQLTGTNRSLNQKVVFTGTLIPTNAVEVMKLRSSLAAQPGTLPPLPQSRVSGRAVVGGAQAIEINALPSKP